MPVRAASCWFTVSKKPSPTQICRKAAAILLISLLGNAVSQGNTPDIPLAPLAPYLPPVPAQAFVWTGSVKLSLTYTADFKGENYTEKTGSGSTTREKRGHEELLATLTLVDAALQACDSKCNPAVGNVQFNSYFIERFIAETNELCGKEWIKAVRISTQERFTLGPDGQQGQTTLNLSARDMTPRIEWNAAGQVWTLWLNLPPLTTSLRFYDKVESVDCSGSHPETPTQQLLTYPLPLPALVPLKKQTMTFQNTLDGQTSVPVTGLDGKQYRLNVNYQFRLTPLETK